MDLSKAEKELNSVYFPLHTFRNMNTVQSIWNKIKNNKEILECAVESYTTKYGTKYLRGMLISNFILNYDSKDIDEKLLSKLLLNIFSNKTVYQYRFKDGWTFPSIIVRNNSIKLKNEYKDIIINEILDNYSCHGKQPYDIRYYTIKRNDFDQSVKISIIGTYKDDDIETFKGIFKDEDAVLLREIEEYRDILKEIAVGPEVEFNGSTVRILEFQNRYFNKLNNHIRQHNDKINEKFNNIISLEF